MPQPERKSREISPEPASVSLKEGAYALSKEPGKAPSDEPSEEMVGWIQERDGCSREQAELLAIEWMERHRLPRP
jgi:hypothetical protein